MESSEDYRKHCLRQQTELRRLISDGDQYEAAMELFFSQHALLHASEMAGTESWSFEDEIMSDAPEAILRRIPRNEEHSIAWIIWHIARIEDVTMNLLVAGSPQILHGDNWLDRMGVNIVHTGNAMCEDEIASISDAIDIEALRGYRLAVGRRTQEIARRLKPEDLKRKGEPTRLQRILAEGAVVEAARGIIDYWGRRNVAGLLLMPATRHNLIHLNEALRLKQRRR